MNQEKIIVTIDKDLEDLIPGFLANRNKDIQLLHRARDAGDFPTIQSIGHGLKGVGGGYGFDRMSELGAEIETAAKRKNLDHIEELIETYSDYLARVDIRYA
jgi:HPt (histidine-containing phosphotransfer) domain-containing protein